MDTTRTTNGNIPDNTESDQDDNKKDTTTTMETGEDMSAEDQAIEEFIHAPPETIGASDDKERSAIMGGKSDQTEDEPSLSLHDKGKLAVSYHPVLTNQPTQLPISTSAQSIQQPEAGSVKPSAELKPTLASVKPSKQSFLKSFKHRNMASVRSTPLPVSSGKSTQIFTSDPTTPHQLPVSGSTNPTQLPGSAVKKPTRWAMFRSGIEVTMTPITTREKKSIK